LSGQQWQVSGNAAQVYERQLVPAIFAPWAPRVVALAAPAARQRVLDVACGTGVVARLAAAGIEPTSQHRYWEANGGVTYRDPDGRQVVFVSWVYGRDRT
jgi:ubiquinone/menaquinone biosynthesis C-methylase UbiE